MKIFTTLTAIVGSLPWTDAFLIPRVNVPRAPVHIPLTNTGNYQYSAGVKMGATQQFAFVFSTTVGYVAVAGSNCTTCSSDSSAPKYDPSLSSSYVPPPANANGTAQLSYNGRNIVGTFGVENCALKKDNGTYWNYPNQHVLVAGSDSDSSAIPQSGIVGFGQTAIPTPTSSLIGQFLSENSANLTTLQLGFALNPLPSGSQSGQDSSGGQLSIFGPDTSMYSGSLTNLNVASSNQQQNFGGVPTQLGSFDWTVQTGGWQLASGSQTISGGPGTFATVEMSYPYILVTQADAEKIYAAIPGSQSYTLAPDAVSSGFAVFQDPNALSWSIPCSTTGVTFSISFEGVTVPVQASDFFINIGGTCVGNIKGWQDGNRQTYILGTSFLRSAYFVLSASADSQSNSIGIAPRLFESPSKKSDVGPIVGGVVGGLIGLGLIALAAVLFLRHRRSKSSVPPSSEFGSSAVLPPSARLSSFFSRKKEKNTLDNLIAQPYNPEEPKSEGSPGNVTVNRWSPNAAAEHAFLSPTGSAIPTAQTFAQAGQYASYPQPHSPPPTASSPGFSAYDRPGSAQPSEPLLHPTGQAMWVQRS